MDKRIEKDFVESFIVSRKRVRVLWELNNHDEEKRNNALFHLEEWIIRDYVHEYKSIDGEEDIYNALYSLGVRNSMYIFRTSKDRSLSLPLREAIDNIQRSGRFEYLYSIEANVGFYIGEYFEKFFLYKDMARR